MPNNPPEDSIYPKEWLSGSLGSSEQDDLPDYEAHPELYPEMDPNFFSDNDSKDSSHDGSDDSFADSSADLPKANQSEIREALGQLRKQLLDLTAHNPLISFKHAKTGRYIRLVDELPDKVTQQLYDGKNLTFEPVPLPTKEEIEEWEEGGGTLVKKRPPVAEWAEKCGISASHDLPLESNDRGARRYADSKLQTLYYPDVLEARVSNLYRISRTMVEETGTNPLHLAFGFLEWYEAGSSEKTHFAPLYTLPVALEKGSINRKTNTYEYALRIREDEVQFNASIAARLADDYAFVLPELDPEQFPEEYLSAVEDAISVRFPRWKVHRLGTLTMLNFSRLLMYRDLDPDNWPEGHALDGHPLVNAVIHRTEGKDGQEGETEWQGTSENEHSIDEVEDIYSKFPLVDVADSSQHSALIDAIKGKNLVIQGPPGTGKSQTITNLIAAALHKGKSVLFVSEKLAALSVVKHRMEKLGLGEFCLELHSHNTKKVGVVESLKRRLETPFRDTRYLDFHEDRHRQLSKELNAHAERINRPWKETEMTVLQILVRCVRCRNELQGEWEDLRIKGLTGDSWQPRQHAEAQIEFEAYAEQLNKIARELQEGHGFDRHPWRGIHAADLDGGSVSRIMELLHNWEGSLKHLINTVDEIPGGHEVLVPSPTLKDVESLSNAIALMPTELSDVDWATLGIIRERGLCELDDLAKARDKLVKNCAKFGSLSLAEVVESKDIPVLEEVVAGLLNSGIKPETQLGKLENVGKNVDEILKITDRWAMRFAEYQDYIKSEVPPLLDATALSIDGLVQLEDVIGMNRKLMPGDLSFRSDQLLPSKIKAKAGAFKEQLKALRNDRQKHEEIFDLTIVRKGLDLGSIQKIIQEPSALKRLFSRDYRDARKAIKAAMRNPKANWNPSTITDSLHELEAYFNREEEFTSDNRWKRMLGTAFEGMATDLDRFDRLVNWHEGLEKRFTKGEVKLFSDTELTDSGKWLLEANERCVDSLLRFDEANLAGDLRQLQSLFPDVIRVYGHEEIPNQAAIANPEDEWRRVLDYLNAAVPALSSLLPAFGEEPPETMALAKKGLTRYMSIREAWVEHHAILVEVNALYFAGCLPNGPLPSQVLRDAVANTRKWCEWLDHSETPKTLGDGVIGRASASFTTELRRWHEVAKPVIESEQTMREAFADFMSLRPEEWSEDGNLDVLRFRIAEAAESDSLLPTYLTFMRLRCTLVGKGFAAACDQAEQSGLSAEDIKSVYEYLVTASLAGEIFAEDSELRRFDGILHSKKLKEFRQFDRELMIHTQIRTAALASQRKVPSGYRGARVSEHTDLALILHEMEKQKRHLPLRQLIRRAGKAALALKPCFMMGPRSVAQYLQPGVIEFDLLVIDEASQMRPAEALGAVARCKQLVVVGDSKQLAPTSFFDRVINADEDDDEVFEATVSESILDAVAPVFTRRQLRWHYRSRHPSLIAFSNLQFYDNRLMLFPSPHYSGEALGIRFHGIVDGVFENQVNTVEAMAVADRVTKLIIENPALSLGVATMNAKQKELIERLIEAHAKDDDIFAVAWEKNQIEDEPLFIKNLENVQGDEREVMIISCTYGRTTPGGRVMQRFGPINSAEGGRRLNVLFTRSRTRMEIFSSMVSSDVIISEKSSEGVRALRGMLRYAETGIIEGAVSSGREPDSDFEIAVARMLQERGYEVECQIGVAGFFIDLGVKHPTRDGEYILGVECDGAAYHSSKSARDRDRIRQDVLESMGWTIERIWSTDWFADPEKALQPILEELAQHGKGL
jgi:very-short-patch-repair endonuclease